MKYIKALKNIAALLLTLLLILPAVAVSPVVYAEEAKADIGNLQQEIQILSRLGIIDASDYADANASFTRGELAHRMVSVMNLQDITMSRGLPFCDVPSDYPYYQDILKMCTYGIMNGYSETSFMPNQKVTASEVIVVIMRALGYETVAESGGGYYIGYLTQAAKEGLLKDISSNALDEYCANSTFAFLVYNMLDIPVYGIDSFEDDNVSIKRGDIYMTAVLGIKEVEGVLMGNAITSVDSGTSTGDGYVRIDNTTYRIADISLDDYVGYPVTAYYKDDTAMPVIMYAYVRDDSCDTLIYKDDIGTDNFSGGKITYTTSDGTKTKTVNIPKDAYLLYNNEPADSLKTMENDGVYILVDNDDNGDIDVVRMEEYTNLFIDYINVNDGKVYDRYDAANNIDISSEDVGNSVFIYNENGDRIDISDMETGIVYSCVRSINDTKIVIHAVIDEVVGVIESVETDSDGYFENITFGGRTIEVPDNLKFYLADSDIKIGKTTLIGYLGATGKLAAFDNTSAGKYKFAYLSKLGTDGGLDKKLRLQLHVSGGKQGQFEVYDLANTVTIDGISYKSTNINEITDVLQSSEGKVISFEINSDGKILTVGTIDGGTLTLAGKGASDVYYRSGVIGNVGLSSSTAVIFIPDSGEEKYFTSGSNSMLTHDSTYTGYEAYTIDDDHVAADVFTCVAQAGPSGLGGDASHMIITKTSKYGNSETGEIGTRVTGYVLGSLMTFNIEETTECFALNNEKLAGVKAGDVIRYVADTSNNLTSVQVLYSLDGDKIYAESTNGLPHYPSNADIYKKPRVLRALAYKMDGTHLLLTYKDPSTDMTFNELNDTEIRSLDSNTVYIYDESARDGDKITIGNKKDIMTYCGQGNACSEIFAVTRGTLIETIIIIK